MRQRDLITRSTGYVLDSCIVRVVLFPVISEMEEMHLGLYDLTDIE